MLATDSWRHVEATASAEQRDSNPQPSPWQRGGFHRSSQHHSPGVLSVQPVSTSSTQSVAVVERSAKRMSGDRPRGRTFCDPILGSHDPFEVGFAAHCADPVEGPSDRPSGDDLRGELSSVVPAGSGVAASKGAARPTMSPAKGMTGFASPVQIKMLLAE